MKAKVLSAFVLLTILSVATVFAAAPSITADRQYFDVSTGLHVLSGNVHIEHNGRIVTAGEAKTNLVEIWGSGGVTFTQDDIYFAGNSVYVYFPSNTAQIEGNVNFSRPDIQITANRVDFNWQNKTAVFSGNVQVTQNGTSWTANSINYNVVSNTVY
jgi:Uncharacterized protein conserved in bacteria